MAVLSSLVLLAAIVLPTWANARSATQRVVCSDNLRRIINASILYASDSHDHVPHPSWGSLSIEAGPDNWCYATRLLDGSVIPPLAGTFDVTPQIPFFEAGQLRVLVKTREVLICPEDWRRAQVEERSWYLMRAMKLTSYSMNGAVIGYGRLPASTGMIRSGRTHRLTAFRPDAIAFWETNEQTPFRFEDAGAAPNESQTSRHEYGGWVARFDGAVEHLDTRTFRALSGDTEPPERLPNRLWCNPDSPDGR
jgi:hypothetical protein